jgi:hypothetical protein
MRNAVERPGTSEDDDAGDRAFRRVGRAADVGCDEIHRCPAEHVGFESGRIADRIRGALRARRLVGGRVGILEADVARRAGIARDLCSRRFEHSDDRRKNRTGVADDGEHDRRHEDLEREALEELRDIILVERALHANDDDFDREQSAVQARCHALELLEPAHAHRGKQGRRIAGKRLGECSSRMEQAQEKERSRAA